MKNENILNKGLSFIQFVIIFGLVSIILGLVIIITNPLQHIKKADDNIRKNDIKQLQIILEEYYRDRERYPSSKDYKIVDFKTKLPVAWGDAWIPYINSLPKDPSPNRTYVYYSTNNNQTYYLYAALEDGTDTARCFSAGPGICESLQENNIPPNACGVRCNFGVSSPNTSP